MSSAFTGWTRKRGIFLAVSSAVVAGLLFWVSEVLLPFILAGIIAFVLTPLVAYCEARRIPRSASIVLVYLATFALLVLGTATVVPRIYDEAVRLRQEVPTLAEKFSSTWGPWAQVRLDRLVGRNTTPDLRTTEGQHVAGRPVLEWTKGSDGSQGLRFNQPVDIVQEGPNHWRIQAEQASSPQLDLTRLATNAVEQSVEYVKKNALEVIRVGQAIVSSTTRGVFLAFMTLMCAGYLIHTRDQIMDFFRSLPPEPARPSFDRLLRRMDRGLSGVVRGQLMICAVNGVLSAVGFALFQLKYWPILAIIAGVLSIIPIFGSIMSTIPAVLIGLTQDVWTALWVFVWIVVIHQLEAHFLNPKIIGASAKLHPVMVVFVLVVGEHFYGLWGALLAVPALSVSQSVFNHFRYESLSDAGPDSLMPGAPEGWARVRPPPNDDQA